ncbi:MAG TPA: hypothetical protein VFG04_08555 [Planctomycetaceae bacterium]|nr:hypothetical protein [Planctomycetaceae bacterium]
MRDVLRLRFHLLNTESRADDPPSVAEQAEFLAAAAELADRFGKTVAGSSNDRSILQSIAQKLSTIVEAFRACEGAEAKKWIEDAIRGVQESCRLVEDMDGD